MKWNLRFLSFDSVATLVLVPFCCGRDIFYKPIGGGGNHRFPLTLSGALLIY